MGKFKNNKPKWKKSAREKKAAKYKNYIGNKAEGIYFPRWLLTGPIRGGPRVEALVNLKVVCASPQHFSQSV